MIYGKHYDLLSATMSECKHEPTLGVHHTKVTSCLCNGIMRLGQIMGVSPLVIKYL